MHTFAETNLLTVALKRILHIFVALVLIVSTTGFSLTRHYCSGDLISTSVMSTPVSCCGEDSDCCHNEHELVQLKADYAVQLSLDVDKLPSFDIMCFFNAWVEIVTVETTTSVYLKKDFIPPPVLSAVLAANQSFLL